MPYMYFYPRVKCFHHKFTPESCCFGGIRGRKTTSLAEHHLPPEWCHTWDCESASCLSALLRVFPSTWGRSCSPHGASVRTDPNGGKDKKLTEKKKHLSLTPSAKSSRWVPTADLLISDPFMCALRRAAAVWCLCALVFRSQRSLSPPAPGRERRDARWGWCCCCCWIRSSCKPLTRLSVRQPAPSCGSVDITNCVAAASVRPPTSQAEKSTWCESWTQLGVIFFFPNWTNRITSAITHWLRTFPPFFFLHLLIEKFIIILLGGHHSPTWRHCIRDSPARSTRIIPSPTLRRRATSSGREPRGRGRRRASRDPGSSTSTAGTARTRM